MPTSIAKDRSQYEDCPRWCHADHETECHPDDRMHLSFQGPVPVVGLVGGTVALPPGGSETADLEQSLSEAYAWENLPEWIKDGESEVPLAEFTYNAQRRASRIYTSTYASEFDIVRFQRVTGGDEWVLVGDDLNGWVLSIESASRVFRALAEVLAG